MHKCCKNDFFKDLLFLKLYKFEPKKAKSMLMKQQKYLYIFPIILFTGLLLASNYNSDKWTAIPESQSNTLVEQGNEPFDKMMAVLTHQRCVNCHPAGEKPRKGDDSHVTRALGVARGAHGEGLEGLTCKTCHTDQNNDYSGVPGAPHWALAPESMAWEGLSRVEIARSMLNRDNNGNKSLEDIVEHLTEHELVLWAWDPGVDAEGLPREKPPVSKEDYIEAVKAWAEAGAIIPEK